MNTTEIKSEAKNESSAEGAVSLRVEFFRIKEGDKAGMCNIYCDGPGGWYYANIGPYHGMQGDMDGENPKIMEFGAKLTDLMREYFGDVPPILDR